MGARRLVSVVGIACASLMGALLAVSPAQAVGEPVVAEVVAPAVVISPQSSDERVLWADPLLELNPPAVALPADTAPVPVSTSKLAVTASVIPEVPTGMAGEDLDSLSPLLSAVVSSSAGGQVTAQFNVRRPHSSTWDIAAAVPVTVASGQRVFYRFPSPVLEAGQAFEWQVRACQSGSCSAWTSAVTEYLNPAQVAGRRSNASLLDFETGSRLRMWIDVGTGGLSVESTDLVVPGVNDPLVVGAVYNSKHLGGGSGNVNNDGQHGWAWRTRVGADVRLLANPNGTLTYIAPGGQVSLFTPASGLAFTSPAETKGDLNAVGSGHE